MVRSWSIECVSFWEGRGRGSRYRVSGPPNTHPILFGLDFGNFAVLFTKDAQEGVTFCYFEDDRPISGSVNGNYDEYAQTVDNCLAPYRRSARSGEILIVELRRSIEMVKNCKIVFRDWKSFKRSQILDTLESLVPRRLLPRLYQVKNT